MVRRRGRGRGACGEAVAAAVVPPPLLVVVAASVVAAAAATPPPNSAGWPPIWATRYTVGRTIYFLISKLSKNRVDEYIGDSKSLQVKKYTVKLEQILPDSRRLVDQFRTPYGNIPSQKR